MKHNWCLMSYFQSFSSLMNVLPDHLNAEVVAGTICSKQDALDYLTWTYFFRRLLQVSSLFIGVI